MALEAAARGRDGAIRDIGDARPPDRPARPARPELKRPGAMPRRRGAAGRIALLHAIAHIELNAIDLAWDMIARFAATGWPRRSAKHSNTRSPSASAHSVTNQSLPRPVQLVFQRTTKPA